MNQNMFALLLALCASTVLGLGKFTPYLNQHSEIPAHIQNLQGDNLTAFINSNNKWTADQSSPVAQLPEEQQKFLLGVLDTPAELQNLVEEQEVNMLDEEVPEEFDGRQEWSKCKSLNHIRDQANCGSCWAVAAAEAISDRICIASNGESQVSISAEDLLSCCGSCGYGCNGGYPIMAWNYFWWTGIVSGGDYGSHEGCRPYSIKPCALYPGGKCTGSAKTPKCVSRCESNTLVYKTDKHFGKFAYKVPRDEKKIRAEIVKNGPVEAAFTVFADFMQYKGGVYEHVAGRQLGGHAVKIVGFGKDKETGKKYWLVANSWGEKWGEQGYFRIARGNNECGFEGGIVAGSPKL